MANYPREYGWHTDSDAADESKNRDSSPATERYPLEWGTHLDPPENDASQAPVFTPVMPALLGGAHPDTFPIGVPPASSAPTGLTPASWPANDVASDIPTTDEALHDDGTQLAQARPPTQQSPKQAMPPPQAPQGRAISQTQQAPTAQVRAPDVVETEFSRRHDLWDEIVRGQPDTSRQRLLPDDWEATLNANYVKWTREAAARTGVPEQLLARHIWKESTYNPTAERKTKYGTYKGMGQLGPAAITALGLNPRTFQYFDAKPSIDATAAYLALTHRQLGNWPAAVAAYNAGPGNVGDWLNGKPTAYRGPNGETTQALRHVFRGDPNAFGQ